MNGFLYKLIDPVTNKTRYIGKTVCSIEKRYSQHLSNRKRKQYVSRWINKLLINGKKPIIKKLYCVTDNIDNAEMEMILHYKQFCRLTNLTNGGDGSTGLKHSEEAKRKISRSRMGIKLSLTEEQRKKIGLRNLGKKFTEEHRRKIGESQIGKIGKRHSMETKLKIKLICTGRKHSSETREKMSILAKKRYGVIDENKKPNSIRGIKKPQWVIDKIRATGVYDKIKERNMSDDNYAKKMTKMVLQYDLCGNLIKEWKSAKDVGIEFNINPGIIRTVCSGARKTSCGFIWKYKQ